MVEDGPQQGPVILFLHGFPEYWYAWRKQIPFFAAKGFRVVVPDQRGYNLSSKPAGIRSYTIEKLSGDIAALISRLGTDKVFLVGHDWGGAIAWATAMTYPHLLRKLIILNLPHPQVMRQHLCSNPRQMLRSWYVAFFQLPWLPEWLSSSFDFKLLSRAITRTAHPGTFTTQDLAHYKQAWQQPGARRAMINWYRAYRHSQVNTSLPVATPTLLLWGMQDAFLVAEMAPASIARCEHGQLVRLPQASHWLHHEQADQVNALIYDFVQEELTEAGLSEPGK